MWSLAASPVPAADPHRTHATPLYDVSEKSIAELQAALASGQTTSRALVQSYLARIRAYDAAGPQLNAIIRLNPHALADADALDKERKAKGPRGPLHGVPILVKDNFDTADMPTSGGTLALATLQPTDDAEMVRRLKAAGAIILGKTAMHELAAGVVTVSSLTGASRNPYDPARSPGGSSGGTGAAVAASFAAAGMGTDTCGSIRIPSAYQNLFGLRETRGLSSRAGVIPLSSTQDIPGPLARTVADLAVILQATAGEDPADPSTAGVGAHIPASYMAALRPDGLKGARIGVLRSMFGAAPEDREVVKLVDKALETMKTQGAEIIEVSIPGMDDLLKDSSVIAYEFRSDLADYLARQPHPPVRTLGEIIDHGLDHEEVDARLRQRDASEGRDSDGYRKALAKRRELHDRVMALMAEQHLDALAYPGPSRRPPLIGDPAPDSGNCQLSVTTGLPAMAMPVGFTPDGLPAGLELLGADFAEPTLLRLAYGWEQAAKPRRAPFSTPPLRRGYGPAPVTFTVNALALRSGPATWVTFRYDPSWSRLDYHASVRRLGGDSVIAVTLQRGDAQKPGPVLDRLVALGRTSGSGSLTLKAQEREDLLNGRLFVQVYTVAAPLGLARQAVVLSAENAPAPRRQAESPKTQAN